MARTLQPATKHLCCPLATRGTRGVSLAAAASGDARALQGCAGERGGLWAVPPGARGHRRRAGMSREAGGVTSAPARAGTGAGLLHVPQSPEQRAPLWR